MRKFYHRWNVLHSQKLFEDKFDDVNDHKFYTGRGPAPSFYNLRYKAPSIDSVRFMANSLSSLIDNLAKRLLKVKCKNCKSCLEYVSQWSFVSVQMFGLQ